MKVSPSKKETGFKVDPFLVGFFCCHGFFVIRFWFVDVFLVLGWLKGPGGGLSFIPE